MAEPTIRFNYAQNRHAVMFHAGFEALWLIYLSFIGLMCMSELASMPTGLQQEEWVWIMVPLTGWQFMWVVLAFTTALMNALAVTSRRSDLPCIELRYSVAWHVTYLALCSLALRLWVDVLHRQAHKRDALWFTLLVVSVHVVDGAVTVAKQTVHLAVTEIASRPHSD